jgi:hypothetical protein
MDEMQLLANKFLNDLSILFNLCMDSENPFILILTGLPYFIDKLALKARNSLLLRCQPKTKNVNGEIVFMVCQESGL